MHSRGGRWRSAGGYFKDRMLAAGATCASSGGLARAVALARAGLVVSEPARRRVHPSPPPAVTADALTEPVDLVLLSRKRNDLDSASGRVADLPAVVPIP
jgi:hypothetical protein